MKLIFFDETVKCLELRIFRLFLNKINWNLVLAIPFGHLKGTILCLSQGLLTHVDFYSRHCDRIAFYMYDHTVFENHTKSLIQHSTLTF